MSLWMGGNWIDHVFEFSYFGFVLGESSKDRAECYMEMSSRRRVAGVIL